MCVLIAHSPTPTPRIAPLAYFMLFAVFLAHEQAATVLAWKFLGSFRLVRRIVKVRPIPFQGTSRIHRSHCAKWVKQFMIGYMTDSTSHFRGRCCPAALDFATEQTGGQWCQENCGDLCAMRCGRMGRADFAIYQPIWFLAHMSKSRS